MQTALVLTLTAGVGLGKPPTSTSADALERRYLAYMKKLVESRPER